MPEQKIRFVLDTNQIVGAGTGWLDQGQPSPDKNDCRRLLIHVAESQQGLYCGKIIGEYLEKLIDRKHPPERAAKLVTYLMGAFSVVSITTASAPIPPTDTDDEVFILCAIDGEADYLVTEDKHLLTLKASYARPMIDRSASITTTLGI